MADLMAPAHICLCGGQLVSKFFIWDNHLRQKRGRSEHEKARRKLPLPEPRESDAPGFVGYAVNLIQLRPEDEHLRDSVFWDIFQRLMVFRTEEDAVK
jgi:hypothetical protein